MPANLLGARLMAVEIPYRERAHMAWECASFGDAPVVKDDWMKIVTGALEQAVLAEREACAKIADYEAQRVADSDGEVWIAAKIRDAIRART